MSGLEEEPARIVFLVSAAAERVIGPGDLAVVVVDRLTRWASGLAARVIGVPGPDRTILRVVFGLGHHRDSGVAAGSRCALEAAVAIQVILVGCGVPGRIGNLFE